MESWEMYFERKKEEEEKEEIQKNAKPKFKIGETIEANWAGGAVTKHVITDIKKSSRGFWYSWIDEDGFKNGLYEKSLNKVNNK